VELLGVIREALTNVRYHSAAKSVVVTLKVKVAIWSPRSQTTVGGSNWRPFRAWAEQHARAGHRRRR
jgi:hypothetical protein